MRHSGEEYRVFLMGLVKNLQLEKHVMFLNEFIDTQDLFKYLFASEFLWFLGENDLRMSLYDFETQGCCDGFESYGVNRNQGAESSLAYLISHLTVLQAYEEFHESG